MIRLLADLWILWPSSDYIPFKTVNSIATLVYQKLIDIGTIEMDHPVVDFCSPGLSSMAISGT